MDRRARRRRERMLLASAVKPFTLNASAIVQIEAGPADQSAPVPVTIDAYNGGVMNVSGIGPLVCDVLGVEASLSLIHI